MMRFECSATILRSISAVGPPPAEGRVERVTTQSRKVSFHRFHTGVKKKKFRGSADTKEALGEAESDPGASGKMRAQRIEQKEASASAAYYPVSVCVSGRVLQNCPPRRNESALFLMYIHTTRSTTTPTTPTPSCD